MKSTAKHDVRAKSGPREVISAARRAAFDLLLSVEKGHSHSDDLLRSRAVNALTPADRHLATALVLGVLRWQIRLDAQLQAFLKRPKGKLDAEIRIALRLGAFQLLHMDRIPARAAIDESVELAKQAGHKFASGMVNAVLRKLAGEPHPPSEAAEAIAAHPAWMVERWTASFGKEMAEALCQHGQSQPRLSVRLAAPETAEELAGEGITLESGAMLTVARSVVSGDASATAAFRAGRARIQDEGSQLVAELVGRESLSVRIQPEKILDACAAPGGKTLILAERHPEAKIAACEASAPRLEQLRQRLAFLGDQVECRLLDAATLGEESVYDLALVDVPCSGTGTLGRNPEIRHRLRFEDLARQAERQRAILAAALRALRPGGRAIYSTCSLEPEENEQVVASALAENPDVRVLPLAERIEELRQRGIVSESGAKLLCAALTPEGYLRLLPGALPTDGFFIAQIERIAGNLPS
jgi:16S rRNA (cytosine967-C5)-methyltransferase